VQVVLVWHVQLSSRGVRQRVCSFLLASVALRMIQGVLDMGAAAAPVATVKNKFSVVLGTQCVPVSFQRLWAWLALAPDRNGA
jgi:hypothetical protein